MKQLFFLLMSCSYNNHIKAFDFIAVAPDPPYMEVGHTPAVAGRNFTVVENQTSSIKCVARYGNPAARFKWFIGEFANAPFFMVILKYCSCLICYFRKLSVISV